MNGDAAKIRILLKEILGVYDQVKGKNDSMHIFLALKKIGESNQRRNIGLIKELKSQVVSIRKEEKDGDVLQTITSLLDLIEGRTMESFSTKLTQNTQNVVKISENLVQTDKKVTSLGKDVSKQGKDIRGLTTKVGQLDERVDEQAEKIEQLDQKTLLNMPVWCKQIRNSVINGNHDWVLVAQRLNFGEQDIKAWLTQADPFLSMLQEWFVANKTADAINGLLSVFKELNITDCVKIIEENLKKVENDSADLFKDKDVDNRIVNSPAQVFITFEWSSKKQAKLLKDKLAERLNKDYGLDKEKNR